MFDLLQKGGWIMVPIFLGSIVGLGLFFERLWVLQRKLINPPDILQHLLSLVQSSRWSEARVMCQRVNNPLTRIALSMLTTHEKNQSREALREAAEDAGQREAFFLERGIGALGVVASLEPLMGLLGTVLGMIQAFRQVASQGVGDPRVVANGVWVALLTTAVGLAIAIPAYMGYRFLLSRVDRLVLDLQNDVSILMESMLAPSTGATPQGSPPVPPQPHHPQRPSSSFMQAPVQSTLPTGEQLPPAQHASPAQPYQPAQPAHPVSPSQTALQPVSQSQASLHRATPSQGEVPRSPRSLPAGPLPQDGEPS